MKALGSEWGGEGDGNFVAEEIEDSDDNKGGEGENNQVLEDTDGGKG